MLVSIRCRSKTGRIMSGKAHAFNSPGIREVDTGGVVFSRQDLDSGSLKPTWATLKACLQQNPLKVQWKKDKTRLCALW